MALNKYARMAIGLGVFGVVYGASYFGTHSLFSALENKVNITDVAVGDCLTDLGTAATIQDATKVDCSQKHDAEVIALKQIKSTGSDVPAGTQAQADEFCRAQFEQFVGVSFDQSKLDLLSIYPTTDSWKIGDRAIDCLISEPNHGSNKGSLKNSKQ